mmetsp:Transcript_21596/g.27474  ORF Transcript_21596/g.27474 Transcript_21596/m.27474 type:complete len:110 (-) Transcript_21596:64-393(-)
MEDLEQLNEGKWAIKFFAPWCGHCQALAPVWTRISTTVDDSIKVAKVDCSVEGISDYCSAHEVTGFPTIQAWENGENISTYDGERNYGGIRNWIHKKLLDDNSEAHEEL